MKMAAKTNYFSHDANARNDSKIVRLRMRHGAAGYGVYFMILERLREDAQYMSVKDYEMIAFDFRVDAALVKSVVEDFGLFAFTDDGERFYSDSFNVRMSAKDEVSRQRSEMGKKGGAPKGNRNAAKNPSEPSEEQADEEKQPTACFETTIGLNKNNQKQPTACFETSKESKGKERKESKENIVVDDARVREGDEFLQKFFDEHALQVETLCMQLHTPRDALRDKARQVVAEWQLTEATHEDYRDKAQHLINQLRIKVREDEKAKRNADHRQRLQDRRGEADTAATSAADYQTTF